VNEEEAKAHWGAITPREKKKKKISSGSRKKEPSYECLSETRASHGHET